jgi:hydroxymethylpyrimidine/phosphomethylpyrimidine kinase
MIQNVLSIAGSDPSGGAGIQADLKTFSALGCYGMAVITALTAQNTQGVTGVHELPAAFVVKQIKTIFADIHVDAVKIGMAGSAETIKALAAVLKKYKPRFIVLDPVMVAQSGDRLLSDESITALKKYLIPQATIITPNIPEAAALLGRDVGSNLEEAAKNLVNLGAHAVLLKGGHMEGPICIDVYADKKNTFILQSPRVKTENNHGTGCTLSSALACYLAKGFTPEDSARAAKIYITDALRHSDKLSVGRGHGPVNHFFQQWKS